MAKPSQKKRTCMLAFLWQIKAIMQAYVFWCKQTVFQIDSKRGLHQTRTAHSIVAYWQTGLTVR